RSARRRRPYARSRSRGVARREGSGQAGLDDASRPHSRWTEGCKEGRSRATRRGSRQSGQVGHGVLGNRDRLGGSSTEGLRKQIDGSKREQSSAGDVTPPEAKRSRLLASLSREKKCLTSIKEVGAHNAGNHRMDARETEYQRRYRYIGMAAQGGQGEPGKKEKPATSKQSPRR